MTINRRRFLQAAAAISGGMLGAPLGVGRAASLQPQILRARRQDIPGAQVAFVKTQDRADGIRRALDLLPPPDVRGKHLFLKPNYNSTDPTPGSTHNDTLRVLIQHLQKLGADRITVGDRAGMGNARRIMQQRGLFDLAGELGFEALPFEDLADEDWALMQPENGHWARGFAFARPALDADGIVQTCCLKTHRYGGHITLSLKNSVGLVAKTLRLPEGPYNFMSELHASPDQRRMIAEINLAYQPDLIVLDGVEAFTTGGPDTGTLVQSQVILAGTDRVAIDAVGVSLLRYYGTTPEVSRGTIFENEQIARAVELGLGVDEPDKIELITGDADSAAYADEIRAVLLA